MSEPQVSLSTIMAVMCDLTGLVLVGLSFWEPGFGFVGLACIAGGCVLTVRGLLKGLARRERDAFELGREAGTDVRKIR